MTGKRRWLQISLRTFLIAFTCVAIAFGWFAHYAQQRRAAFAAIRNAGGDIEFGLRTPRWYDTVLDRELTGEVIKVDLRKGKVDDELLTHIGVLKELRKLDLSNAAIDDEGLRRIARLPLRELWLQKTNITDASAATLSSMQTIGFLQLNATALSDDFLEHLESLPQLEDLGLRGTRVTGAGMKFLSRHPKLKKLDVYSAEVDDNGVQCLLDCQSLTEVGISMTKVTNRVFEHLDMLPNLVHVDVSGNRSITTEAVSKFRTGHPNCNVEWYGK